MSDDVTKRLQDLLAHLHLIDKFVKGNAKENSVKNIETVIMALTEIDTLRSDVDALRSMVLEFRSLSTTLAYALVATQNGEAGVGENPIAEYLRVMETSESLH